MRFYLENSICEYYTEDSFKNMLAENQSRLNLKCSTLETGLSFLHILLIHPPCQRVEVFYLETWVAKIKVTADFVMS